MEALKVVGAVIHKKEDDTFFVGQRARGRRFAEKYEFIGGKVDPVDINLMAATEREVWEEIGKKIKALRVLGDININYTKNADSIHVYFVECEPFEGEIEDTETVRENFLWYGWVPREELSSLDWVEADAQFAKDLATGIQYQLS